MHALLDLLMPPRCAGCSVEGQALCDACGTWLARRRDEPPGIPIGLAWPLPVGLDQLEWCAAFTGPVRASLHALKYRGERRLGAVLGAALADRWQRAGHPIDIVVHVPVHASRLRERGFDQARDLAQVTARALGRPAIPALERAERTAAMHGLGRADRARNVGGAFRVRPAAASRIAGRTILVVDDVMTTGATLSGCAQALRAAGAAGVCAIAVARER